MKTIEEKAKAYDEAKARMSRAFNSNRCTIGFMNEIFPEFKKSKELEDEKIRKEIIEYIKIGTYHKSWLAWLEKQGEHANFRNHIEVGDKVTRNEAGMLVNLSQLKRVAKPAEKQDEPIGDTDTVDSNEDGLVAETIKYKHENQGEPKPACDVESKFKVGDWVVYKYRIGVIVRLLSEHYIISFDGREEQISFTWELGIRKWTIQDAKDGDILVIKEGKRPFIFNGLLDKFHPECPTAYCGIAIEDEFFIPCATAWWTDEEVCPATKEQCALLFRKMKEAGYEWDAEKKELKTISQEYPLTSDECIKSAWSEEDENYKDALIGTITEIKNQPLKRLEDWDRYISWLKSLKDKVQPKQEWSKEDNIHLTNAILAAEKEWGIESCTSEWLKSLRPQPKIEWSKEDEKMYASIMDDTVQENQLDEKQIDWLRNIKYRSFFAQPKKQWKPTEEQMKVLEYYIDAAIDTKDMVVLYGLYNDLKQLK